MSKNFGSVMEPLHHRAQFPMESGRVYRGSSGGRNSVSTKQGDPQPSKSQTPSTDGRPSPSSEGYFSKVPKPVQELVLSIIKSRGLEDTPETRDDLAEMVDLAA